MEFPRPLKAVFMENITDKLMKKTILFHHMENCRIYIVHCGRYYSDK